MRELQILTFEAAYAALTSGILLEEINAGQAWMLTGKAQALLAEPLRRIQNNHGAGVLAYCVEGLGKRLNQAEKSVLSVYCGSGNPAKVRPSIKLDETIDQAGCKRWLARLATFPGMFMYDVDALSVEEQATELKRFKVALRQKLPEDVFSRVVKPPNGVETVEFLQAWELALGDDGTGESIIIKSNE